VLTLYIVNKVNCNINKTQSYAELLFSFITISFWCMVLILCFSFVSQPYFSNGRAVVMVVVCLSICWLSVMDVLWLNGER